MDHTLSRDLFWEFRRAHDAILKLSSPALNKVKNIIRSEYSSLVFTEYFISLPNICEFKDESDIVAVIERF